MESEKRKAISSGEVRRKKIKPIGVVEPTKPVGVVETQPVYPRPEVEVDYEELFNAIASPPPPPPPSTSQTPPPLFAPIQDFTWNLTNLRFALVSSPLNGRCSIKCFCGIPVVKNELGIIKCGNACNPNTSNPCCNFSLNHEAGLTYYVKEVLGELFTLPQPVENFMRYKSVVWFQPYCNCGHQMTIGVWNSMNKANEMYWNACCSNPNTNPDNKCRYRFIPGKIVLQRMREYLLSNEQVRNECLAAMQ